MKKIVFILLVGILFCLPALKSQTVIEPPYTDARYQVTLFTYDLSHGDTTRLFTMPDRPYSGWLELYADTLSGTKNGVLTLKSASLPDKGYSNAYASNDTLIMSANGVYRMQINQDMSAMKNFLLDINVNSITGGLLTGVLYIQRRQ